MTNKDIINRNHKGLLQGYCIRYNAEDMLLFRLNYHNGTHIRYCERHKHYKFVTYFIR